METTDFEVNEMYSKLSTFFKEKFNLILLPEEILDIIKRILDDDGEVYTREILNYVYDIHINSQQLNELKELVKLIKSIK